MSDPYRKPRRKPAKPPKPQPPPPRLPPPTPVVVTVDNVEIGRRIRRTREALGFPEGFQEYFAKNWFGISKGTWGTYENGRNGFPLRAALKLKVQFGIPTDWIYAADPSRLPLDVAVKLGLARRLDPDAD